MSFEIQELNPYIRLATRSVLRAGHEIKRRVLFDYELIYVESGSFLLTYDEREYVCEAGRFLLLRPGVPHTFSQIRADVSQPHIHFDLTYTADSPQIPISFKDIDCFSEAERRLIARDAFSEAPLNPFVDFSDREEALRLFFEVVQGQRARPVRAKACFIMLLARMIEDCFAYSFQKRDPADSLARRLKDYLDAGHAPDAKLEDLEKLFSYSRYHLERVFRERFGVGIIAYRNQKRMEQARELLKHETVTAVAARLGFSSIYVFSRAYKLYYGCAPSKSKNEIKI